RQSATATGADEQSHRESGRRQEALAGTCSLAQHGAVMGPRWPSGIPDEAMDLEFGSRAVGAATRPDSTAATAAERYQWGSDVVNNSVQCRRKGSARC